MGFVKQLNLIFYIDTVDLSNEL